jgi:hypothetical protein
MSTLSPFRLSLLRSVGFNKITQSQLLDGFGEARHFAPTDRAEISSKTVALWSNAVQPIERRRAPAEILAMFEPVSAAL